jgi:hypothetical protein
MPGTLASANELSDDAHNVLSARVLFIACLG